MPIIYGLTGFRQPGGGASNPRVIEAVDPVGAVERVEYWWTDGPMPATAPASEVPPGFEGRNSELNTITSLHWAKGRNTANRQPRETLLRRGRGALMIDHNEPSRYLAGQMGAANAHEDLFSRVYDGVCISSSWCGVWQGAR